MMAHCRRALLLLSLLRLTGADPGLCQGVRSAFALLNQPFTFPCDASMCLNAEWKKSLPTNPSIATKQNQLCSIKKGFEEDFRCEENHLFLTAAKYTDLGTYLFICNTSHQNHVTLDVLYALNVNAVETDSITLDCYSDSAKDVMWLHNKEHVLQYKTGGSIDLSRSYEGRASLGTNCFRTGDLSLRISAVRRTDGGIYRCFVDEGTSKGYPHAYVLHVNERSSSPETAQINSSCTEESDLIIYKTLTAVFGLLFLLTLVYTIYRHIITTSNLPTEATLADADDAPAANCALLCPYNTPTNTSVSVQESNADEGKPPSTTQPIF